MTFEITYGSDSKGDDKEKEENTVEFHFLDFWEIGSNDGKDRLVAFSLNRL